MTSKLDLFITEAVNQAKERRENKNRRGKANRHVDPFALTDAGETEYQISKRRLEAFTLRQKTLKWTYTAVTLLIRESTCKCCGQVQEQWPDGVFITMKNKYLGKHEKNISEDYTPEMYPGIPRQVEYMQVDIPTCIECFKAEEFRPDQPDLFPETVQTFSIHEPFANEKIKLNQINYELKELEKSHD